MVVPFGQDPDPSIIDPADLPAVQTVGVRLPFIIPPQMKLVLNQHNRAFVVIVTEGNPYALPVGSRPLTNRLRACAAEAGIQLRKKDLEDLNDQLRAAAEINNFIVPIWYRNAPVDGGVEIDLGDSRHTRIRITAGSVETVRTGSKTIFFRTPVSRPLMAPAENGDLQRLRGKVNMSELDYWLFVGWMAYTLAHPKCPATKYLILVIQGDQGTGKTYLCAQIILNLLDPNVVGVQIFPESERDLAIGAQNALVLCFDNMRNFRAKRSDFLCTLSTGGTLSNRALYTDSDLHTHHLHAALVLNGIHNVVTQADMAQRSLPVHTLPLDERHRRSEAEMLAELETDLPLIFRGLLDLISQILVHLPNVEVLHPERMIDFVRWLAAMERTYGMDPGCLQSAYSNALRDAQEDSLEQNSLGAAMVEFARRTGEGYWTGTPTKLLAELNELIPFGTPYARDWPRNPIALSLRLNGLKASLLTQGITVVSSRGKNREISIHVRGRAHD